MLTENQRAILLLAAQRISGVFGIRYEDAYYRLLTSFGDIDTAPGAEFRPPDPVDERTMISPVNQPAAWERGIDESWINRWIAGSDEFGRNR